MWELDHKEGWVPKNWYFQTIVLEKTLESLLDSQEIKPVNPKGNQPWIVIERADVEAETPILWPPDGKRQLIGRLWCWERLRAGGKGDDRGWDGLDGITNSMDMSLSRLQEIVKNREVRHAACSSGVTKSQTRLEWLNNNKKSNFSSLVKIDQCNKEKNSFEKSLLIP